MKSRKEIAADPQKIMCESYIVEILKKWYGNSYKIKWNQYTIIQKSFFNDMEFLMEEFGNPDITCKYSQCRNPTKMKWKL